MCYAHTQATLSAFPRFDSKQFQYLPATFSILGGNPGVTRGIRSRGVAMYSFTLQEKSTPSGYFCGSGGKPLGNPGHSEANVSKIAFFTCSDLQRLSNTFVKCQSAEAYLSTLAFFDVQKHTMFSCFHAAICTTSQHFRVSVHESVASAPWVPLLCPRQVSP